MCVCVYTYVCICKYINILYSKLKCIHYLYKIKCIKL